MYLVFLSTIIPHYSSSCSNDIDLSCMVIGASVSEPPPRTTYIMFVRTSSCTVTRATRKREAGLITSYIRRASVKYKREQKS